MSLKLMTPTRHMFVNLFRVMGHRPTVCATSKRSYYFSYFNCEKISTNTLYSQVFRGFQVNPILQKCWKCGAVKIEGLFCSHCNALQKPDDGLNYFQVLGIVECYNLNDSELSVKYRKLQNFLHPDRYTNKDEAEQEVSAHYSALVNKAYSTLLNPLERGLYMLQMRGLQLEEGTVQDDPNFLTSVMEINEELDQAKDPEHILKLDSANQLAIEQLTQKVASAFDKGDLNAAKQFLTKMKYYTSINGRIKELKQKLSIE